MAEVRHNNVVLRILARLELEWAQSRDRPGDWWNLREARYIVRNDPQTYTDDELNRATVDAYERFYQNHPFDFAIEIVLGVVESALGLVIGREFFTDVDAEQYDLNTTPHAALGGSTPLQILQDDPSTWPESWHRGNRLADLD